jgi:predicted nucleic acid-binding protein
MREYLAVVTRPQVWATALDVSEAIADTDMFSRRFRILDDGPAVWAELTGLSRRFKFGGRQVHDATIVATMLTHGETELLTFNEVDFRRFGGLIQIISP